METCTICEKPIKEGDEIFEYKHGYLEKNDMGGFDMKTTSSILYRVHAKCQLSKKYK